jgi:hypothetical protein
MESCDFSLVSNIVLLILFVLSEIIGKCKCDANGVIDLVVNCTCKKEEE